jgi:hypothetical protein
MPSSSSSLLVFVSLLHNQTQSAPRKMASHPQKLNHLPSVLPWFHKSLFSSWIKLLLITSASELWLWDLRGAAGSEKQQGGNFETGSGMRREASAQPTSRPAVRDDRDGRPRWLDMSWWSVSVGAHRQEGNFQGRPRPWRQWRTGGCPCDRGLPERGDGRVESGLWA